MKLPRHLLTTAAALSMLACEPGASDGPNDTIRAQINGVVHTSAGEPAGGAVVHARIFEPAGNPECRQSFFEDGTLTSITNSSGEFALPVIMKGAVTAGLKCVALKFVPPAASSLDSAFIAVDSVRFTDGSTPEPSMVSVTLSAK